MLLLVLAGCGTGSTPTSSTAESATPRNPQVREGFLLGHRIAESLVAKFGDVRAVLNQYTPKLEGISPTAQKATLRFARERLGTLRFAGDIARSQERALVAGLKRLIGARGSP